MSEKLKNSGETTSSTQSSAWDNMPPYDPARAAALRAQYNNTPSSDSKDLDQSSTPETSDQLSDPSELKDTAKMATQLEKLGANPAILNNPAFQRELSNLISSYGLLMAHAVDAQSHTPSNLSLNCKGKHGDAREHDRSTFNLIAQQDGSFTIECASVDRRAARYHFDELNASPDSYTSSFEDENNATIINFQFNQKDGGFAMYQSSSSESQYYPQDNPGDKVGHYFAAKSETRRQFDANGDEQFREDVHYTTSKLDHGNYLSPHLGRTSWTEGNMPDHATFNYLKVLAKQPYGNVTERTSYQRNPDNTIHVRDYANGKAIELDVNMNTQYGTSELIPANYSITAAREAAAKE